MRSHLNFLLSLLILLAIPACSNTSSHSTHIPTIPTVNQANPKIFGVFEGITPCSTLAKPLTQIPEDAECEQMIWKIILYQDPATGIPTTYELNSAYGLSQQNSNGLDGGGTEITLSGKWDVRKGTAADANAVVYQLNPDVPEESVSFIKIGEDVLHVLSQDGALLVGHGAWSYTINRTDTHPYQHISNPGSAPEAKTPLVAPTMPVGSSLLGVFEGRTPCHEIVFEMTGVAPYSRCLKIKLQLTLYQDEKGAPHSYVLRGTSTIRTGTWRITQGTKTDADAVIYQLYSNESQDPVSFLKADDNHLFLLDGDTSSLVGNALFSYTLSRTK